MIVALRASARWAVVLLVVVTLATGCSRQRYRLQADREVQSLVQEKSNDPRWALPGFDIEMSSYSRYYDPYNPDKAPMPPDDPSSHVYMHCVDGKKGWPHWHDNGSRRRLENADWREHLAEYVPVNEEKEVVLTIDSALRLAYIHLPEHQTQLETLYLSALDVSTERFRLQTQFFGGADTTYNHVGRANGNGADLNGLAAVPNVEVRKRFATAGQLIVGFANSFVWQFSGADQYGSLSLVNLSLVQPLLRGAGRDIALEQLTIVERGLLANLRAYQRYRQGLVCRVAIGESGVQGAQRQGGFFGGTGLTGFTGTGSGGLGGVGGATGFGRGGTGGASGGTGSGAGFAGGGAGTVGGLIGLLQTLQEIRNTENSLQAQLRTLDVLEANLEAGVIDLTQVDQFRQSVESERANLLQATNAFETALDAYKTGTLGLPPDLPVKLDDTMIQQFQLLDLQTTDVQSALEDLQDEVGNVGDQPTDEQTRAVLAEARARAESVREVLQDTKKDADALDERIPKRLAQMENPDEQETFTSEMEILYTTLNGFDQRVQDNLKELEEIEQSIGSVTNRQAIDRLVVWLRGTTGLVQEMSLVQARSRVESIVLDPVVLDPKEAFRLACTYRLDLMNNRAALVDSWRLIQFNADALQSNLNLFIDADAGTRLDHPLRSRRSTATAQAGIEFDAPFTRLLERNNYRQALIDYQQDRRQLIQFYDGVHQSLRSLLRQMKQLQVNLEIQRRAVVIAIRRVDLTREDLNEPSPPPAPGEAASQLGPTAATNSLTALSDLRNTQNNFMSVWLNYYANRLRLLRDTGLMQLDENGNWIDVPLGDAKAASEEELAPPPPVPDEWIQQAFEAEEEKAPADGQRPLGPVSHAENVDAEAAPDTRGQAAGLNSQKASLWK